MAVNRIVIIRPGETDWNRQGRWQGWVAAPLNEHGRRQVHKLASFVRNIGMSALYASDLRRARETAEILAGLLGYEPVYDARLRERDIGRWQGLTVDEMRAWYPDDYARALAEPDLFRVPGGESRDDVRTRVVPAFQQILTDAPGETVGLLSHSTAIKTLIADLIPDCDERGITLDNSSCSTIARDGDGSPWRLVALADVTHLEGLRSNAIGELEHRR